MNEHERQHLRLLRNALDGDIEKGIKVECKKEDLLAHWRVACFGIATNVG